jgi:hypothetical protein
MALDQAVAEIAAVLGEALVRLIFPILSSGQLTSGRRRALMSDAMKTETQIREEIGANPQPDHGAAQGEVPRGVRRGVSLESQVGPVPARRLAHPG